jgi:hypothetical protein
MNLDRFSQPLAGERLPASHSEELEELQDRQKQEIVRNFISSYHENTNKIPDSWMISETFDHIYLDHRMIGKEIEDYVDEL